MTEIYSRAEVKKELAKSKEVYIEKKSRERVSVRQLKSILKKTGSDGLFSSYVTFPPNTYFDTQEEGEEVVLFLRQHPVVNIPWILGVILALTIPSVFMFFPPYAVMPAGYQYVISVMWLLFTAGFALAKFMSWFFNIYIVTDERIVDIDFVNVLYRRVSIAKLQDIQDVNVVASGAFASFFNYGSVFIQTASEVPEFEFLQIPKPDKVGVIMNQMIDLEEQEKIEGRVK